ncbi:MAG: crotonase/enoyl-CoA hydratase family protein [Desulfatibacillaceae bacterium]
MSVRVEKDGPVTTVILDRPEVKNAVNGPTARALYEAFAEFEADGDASVAVLWGAGGAFCAGADLKALASGEMERMNPLEEDMSACGPMGPSRMRLSKPVIAAVSGFAVAGGLELACWCDLRVVEQDAVFGVYCRRYGVPLIDGGTQRLPRLVGMSRAMDMILTGRSVRADEALAMGLANYVVPPGLALEEARAIAARLAKFPQACMRSDRVAALEGFDMPFDQAMENEFARGLSVIRGGETLAGATRFTRGNGRVPPEEM